MTAFHRTTWNFALQRALEWSRELKKPLVILDVRFCGDPWANERLHHFALDGMAEIDRRLEGRRVVYYPYVEPRPNTGGALPSALATHASAVVTDDFPDEYLQQIVREAAKRLPVLVEKVDANGVLPFRAAPRVFGTAFSFRRFLQKELRSHLPKDPERDPLRKVALPARAHIPQEITKRWPRASRELLFGKRRDLGALRFNHDVGAVALRGGMKAAEAALKRFVGKHLDDYAALRNHPDEDATSNLSPYLAFGHISVHQVLAAVMAHENVPVSRVGGKATGGRRGWWRVGESAEAFLDQLVTWRELGYNMSWQDPAHDRYSSLPGWARTTLADHAANPRPYRYSLRQLEAARTHDALWNAAQTQLVREGRLHNYLRMLWGKKILEWTASPEEALDVMITLNNTYALDGRNPNSYSGIFWVLGRYDRAWGPERQVFGKVRYMSSESTARKLRLKKYMEQYGR